MRITLDTNCFIDAFDVQSHAYSDMQQIIKAYKSTQIYLTVSLHTLSEITKSPEALSFAKTIEMLPHYPIGTWNDQISTCEELAGTWDDAKKNQKIQEELKQLAKSGNDIRDRGAYLDALIDGVDAFVTSDTQFVGSGPAKRIESKFGLRVCNPQKIINELNHLTRQ